MIHWVGSRFPGLFPDWSHICISPSAFVRYLVDLVDMS
jgi:hypothetical protein